MRPVCPQNPRPPPTFALARVPSLVSCWESTGGRAGVKVDRGFCDPATIELRVGAIIAIVAQCGRVFGE